MGHRQMWTGIFSLLGIFFLILDRDTALAGAAQGLELCLRTVIPGLFPFFFLTALLVGSLGSCRVPGPVTRILGIPRGADSLLIPFFLGGYPLGAKTAAESWKSGCISREAAQRLLYFCSNAGPAFLFGVLPAVIAKREWIVSLWIIHIGSAIFIAAMVPSAECQAGQADSRSVSPSHAMESALKASGLVCGWILCFRILTAALDHWLLWRLPVSGQVFVSGLMELTAGCSSLGKIESQELRYLFAAGFLGFGGVSVAMQTASVTEGLSMKPYLIGKLLQGGLSMVFALSVLTHTWPFALLFSVLTVFGWKRLQNRGRKIQVLGV